MKRIIFIFICFTFTHVNAQYYVDALGKNGTDLKTSLHNIIKNHQDQGWPLWSYFYSTDVRNTNQVWDIYSDKPASTPSFIFTLGTSQCGTYSGEGSCYNHEHTWPSTFFNDATPMRTDLNHVLPTDGWVNNKRSNFPYGNVSNPTWTSTNGSKLGVTNSYTNFSSSNSNHYGFEPIDEYKGDIARLYFYMSTRYEGEDGGWANWEMANGSTLTPSAITLLLDWHHADPVSQKEKDRNEAVFLIQGNRNPFIDYPQFADCIWGTTNCTILSLSQFNSSIIELYPNPCFDFISIKNHSKFKYNQYEIMNTLGQFIESKSFNSDKIDIQNLDIGVYYLVLKHNEQKYFTRFIKQ